jgi:hypothetical protein
LHDGITFEKLGIPTAVLCTEPFVPTARTMSRILGIPDYTFAVLPHPLGSLTPGEVKERARVALPQVIEILLAN